MNFQKKPEMPEMQVADIKPEIEEDNLKTILSEKEVHAFPNLAFSADKAPAQLLPLDRSVALLRIVRLALSNPWLTIKLVNLQMLKNFFSFITDNKNDASHIFLKYKEIYRKPATTRNMDLSRIVAALRLMRLALSNPRLTAKLINPSFLKNGVQFLRKGAESGHLIDKYRKLYHGSELTSEFQIHPDIKALVQRYGIPVSREMAADKQITPGEMSEWVSGLKRLVDSIPEKTINISIIIPVYNHIRFTLACIHSIFLNAGRYDFEIIIADDMSNDHTPDVFVQSFRRINYIRSEGNLGFLQNCNASAKHAHGRFIIFLNNDTIVLPDWLDELIRPLEVNPSVGLTGSKLIFADGRLQEAGGIIFEDASGWNYGRFDHPGQPQYNFLRDADYCSGASIAVSLELWQKLGGFDERFSPAYYEDTDLAFQVRAAGKRVVYQPLSEVVHFEGISHGTSETQSGKSHQSVNRLKFLCKWQGTLAGSGTCNPSSLPINRICRGRILVVDAVTPTPDRDSGSIDTYNFLMIFKQLGYHVTFIPENLQYCHHYTRDLRRFGVECIHLPWFRSLVKAVEYYAPSADVVLLYRATIADPLADVIRKHAPHAKLIFNTVDLHFLRKQREAEIFNSPETFMSSQHMREKELRLIKKADATILLSTHEMHLVRNLAPKARLYHIPVVRDIPEKSSISWKKRKDIVFIGGYNHPPNVDAVIFFVKNIWPHLRTLQFPGKFIVAGSDMPAAIIALAADDIIIRGYVTDLADLFGSCRLSVAPLRYGAGMKGKVISSLSHGVPCIATTIATEGTNLIPGENILVEDDPTKMAELIHKVYDDEPLWEKLSASGLNYCVNNCSIESIKEKLNLMLAEITC